MLHLDDKHFLHLQKYLTPLIHDMLERSGVPENLRPYVLSASRADVEFVAKIFLKHQYDTKRKFKFSTYFLEWIRIRMEKVEDALRIKF